MSMRLLLFLREGKGGVMGYTLVAEGSETVKSNEELQFKAGPNCVVDWAICCPVAMPLPYNPRNMLCPE